MIMSDSGRQGLTGLLSMVESMLAMLYLGLNRDIGQRGSTRRRPGLRGHQQCDRLCRRE